LSDEIEIPDIKPQRSTGLDTELARTFLAVVAGGSFIAAADRLHVTQSTVSARIRSLEDRMGVALFVRNKSGAAMTPAGMRFQKHAAFLVRAVEHARQDVGLPEGYRESVVIAARIGLWDGFLDRWLAELRRDMPDIAVRAEIALEPEIMQGLIEGRIDIGVMYTPQRRPNLDVVPLMDERLVLVSSAGPTTGAPLQYLHVDWGPEFSAQYDASFRDAPGPGLSVNIGWLGLRYLLDQGGSGYFPERIVAGLIAEGLLDRVDGAPAFALPAYVVHPSDPQGVTIRALRDRLAALAEEIVGQGLATQARRA
jgi:DNA-binding transcriptional LysR family regulator